MLSHGNKILSIGGYAACIFDKDAKNFIDRVGLDKEANLNVGGLYTAERARLAINYLIIGLKYIGGIDAFYPIVGGTSLMHSFNLLNPDLYRITFETGASGAPIHDGFGWRLGVGLPGIIHNNDYLNNLSFGVSLSRPNTGTDVTEISSFNSLNNGGAFLQIRSDGLIAFRTQGGVQQGFWRGLNKGSYVATKTLSQTNIFFNGEQSVFSFGNLNPSININDNEFRFGEATPTASASQATRSSLFVGKNMSALKGLQLSKLMNDFNTILNRA